MTKDLTKTQDLPPAIVELKNQVAHIQLAMREVMIEGTHYGKVPGSEKPSLWKAGAEKICLLFQLVPEFEIKEINLENNHREYRVLCSIKTKEGELRGQGSGIATTMENKYRWRSNVLVCPKCGNDTVLRSKKEPGFFCWAKKGGCGSNFPETEPSLQTANKSENKDIADVYNTVLKMAIKRAQVDATIRATACSDIFTQDLEDIIPVPKPVKKEPDLPPSAVVTDYTPELEAKGEIFTYDCRLLQGIEQDKYDACMQYAMEQGAAFTDEGLIKSKEILPKLKNYRVTDERPNV